MRLPPRQRTTGAERTRAARVGSFVLWYGLPLLAAAALAAYFAGLLLWHANPPVVPVSGGSMQPTLQPGDLVVLKGVDARTLRKGDVVAFRTPEEARAQYGLPAALVHRIASVERDPVGLLFQTKGDANHGVDVFKLRRDDIVGRMEVRVPAAGLPLLFFRSRQGTIFAGAAVAVLALYFLLGFLDERRAVAAATGETVHTVLEETRRLRDELAARPRVVTSPELELVAGDSARWVDPPARDLAALEREVELALRSGLEARATMEELVGAVAEYGRHLRSHTAVVQGLAGAAVELERAASEMREMLAGLTAVVDELGRGQRS